MKKFFIAFLIPAMVHIHLHSQTIKWSPQQQDYKKTPYLSILGANENGNFYILRSNISLENDRDHSGFRKRAYFLQYYSPEMTVIWEKELLTSYEDGRIADVRLINDRIIVTSYIEDKKSKYYYFYAQFLNDDGKWNGLPMLLDSFLTENLDEDNKPGLIASHDQLFVAFSYHKITKDNQSQKYSVIVMDTNLSVKQRQDIDVPYSSQTYTPVNSILTDQGSFFILGIHSTSEKKSKDPGQNYFELFGYNMPLNRTVNYSIRSDSKFLTDVAMSADNINHNIVVAGFYSDKTAYSVAGVFYYTLTEDSLKETKMINTPFSETYLQKFLGERKESRELVNYSIDRLIVRRDGGAAIVAESVYETSRSYYDYFMQTYVMHVYYHFGSIMLLSVNPDGKILWNNVITKDQNSIDDDGYLSSYFLAVVEGRLATIYNKYIEDDSSVLITFVEPNGMQNTDVLINETEKTYIIPKSAKQIDDETILLPAFRGNKFFIGKVSF